jgi:hypothetical protein
MKAFGFEMVRRSERGVTQLTDGDFNLTLLTRSFIEHDPVNWHFGLEMTMEEIEALRPQLEAMGAEYHDGVRDGRSVEVFIKDPEGHRVDLAPFWPTKAGAEMRQQEYRQWEAPEAARV